MRSRTGRVTVTARSCCTAARRGASGRWRFSCRFTSHRRTFDPAEHLRAVQFSAPFAAPGHRDYLGAILGLGIRREWVGDILVQAHGAFVFCLPSVEPELRTLEQVGRAGVKAAAVPLSAVPLPERKVRPVTFTVQSARLDAVVSGMFRLSRTSAAAQIRAGAVHLNYAECLRPDAPVAPGDDAVAARCGQGRGHGGRRPVAQGTAVRHGGALAVSVQMQKPPHRYLGAAGYKNLRSLTPEIFAGLSCLTRRSARRPERQQRRPDRQRPSANACKRRRRHTR